MRNIILSFFITVVSIGPLIDMSLSRVKEVSRYTAVDTTEKTGLDISQLLSVDVSRTKLYQYTLATYDPYHGAWQKYLRNSL